MIKNEKKGNLVHNYVKTYVPSGNPSVVLLESGKVMFIDFENEPDDVIIVIVKINCSAVTPTVEEIV